MDVDYAKVVDGLRDNGILPGSYQSIFVSGSLVRGWGNATSDLDISVVVTEPWHSSIDEITYVALDPDSVPWESTFVDGRRWEIEYWLESQVDQTFAKVSWEQFNGKQAAWKKLSPQEDSFLERFPHSEPIDGAGWLAGRKEQLAGSAHRSVLVTRSLDYMDSFVEDATGQLDVGDLESAVISVKIAFGHAVDALLAGCGQFGSRWPKWRARRFRAADPPVISFEEFWDVETMRDYDPDAPHAWVERVVLLCQRIANGLSI